MSEPMTVRPEIWPLAADRFSIWLISGDDPWLLDLPVSADGDVHADIEIELFRRGVELADVPVIHSTSWRPQGGSIVLTYAAIVRTPDLVKATWPGAKPVDPMLAEAIGRPPTHAANDAPVPRHADVLHHLLRHLVHLRDHDATTSAALDANWRRHLAEFEPTLATMYDTVHEGRRAA